MPDCLAIDHGRQGALVLGDGVGEIYLAAAWRQRVDAGQKYTEIRHAVSADGVRTGRGTAKVMPTGHQLGMALAAILARHLRKPRLVVEDFYVGKNAGTSLSTALWAGALVGPIEEHVADIRWVKAGDWRNEAFGIPPGTRREPAKARTRESLPADVRERADLLIESVGGSEHVVDACGIYLWGIGRRVVRQEPLPGVVTRRRRG